jgi:hypothetical protein
MFSHVSVNDFVEGLPGGAENFRPFGYREAQRLEAIVKDYAAGMHRVFHRHGGLTPL